MLWSQTSIFKIDVTGILHFCFVFLLVESDCFTKNLEFFLLLRNGQLFIWECDSSLNELQVVQRPVSRFDDDNEEDDVDLTRSEERNSVVPEDTRG